MPGLEPRPHTTIQNPGRTPRRPGPSRHSHLRMGLGLPRSTGQAGEGPSAWTSLFPALGLRFSLRQHTTWPRWLQRASPAES